MWTTFSILSLLAIIDRFTTNLWPRQAFQIGSGSAGNDRLHGFKEGPWSVVAYDILARVSGRFSICCFNFLLITRLHSLQHWMISSWVGKYFLDCSNIINANLRLHRYNAIALCILTFLHVWSILLPCITHGWSAQIVPGNFEFPLSERAPKGFQDANPDNETMSLQVDDIFRMIEMTILLCILLPLSVRWLSTHYHIGMALHRFIMVVYFVDIVRRHSHPHSWLLNTPMFLIWILDKIWNSRFRRQDALPFRRVKLGTDYMVLYWNQPYRSEAIGAIGAEFSFKLYSSSFFEDPHVFTTFENRFGIPMRDNHGPDFLWTNASIIRIFRSKRAYQLVNQEDCSHTMKMCEDNTMPLVVWGPRYGQMSLPIQDALLLGHRPMVLVAGGSGINYAVDTLQYVVTHAATLSCDRLTILFTTRNEHLFEWIVQSVRSLLSFRFSSDDARTIGIRVVLASTSPEYNSCTSGQSQQEENCNIYLNDNGKLSVSLIHGRLALNNEIDQESIVFCQGSASLKASVASVCRRKRSMFVGGLGGAGL